MTNEDMQQLYEIMVQLVKKFTSNESSSISSEKATQIMESIRYALEYRNGFKQEEYSIKKKSETIKEEYEIGIRVKKQLIIIAKEKYNKIMEQFEHYGNQCYYDTIVKGMPHFFTRYDVVFDGCNSILTLDYPTLLPVEDVVGVDRILVYLTRIELEQQLLQQYHSTNLLQLFQKRGRDSSEQIYNLCEFLVENLLLCQYIGYTSKEILLTNQDIQLIEDKLDETNVESFQDSMMKCLIQLEIPTKAKEYIIPIIKTMSSELYYYGRMHKLGQMLFLWNEESTDFFLDGVQMEDFQLREVIEGINEEVDLTKKLDLFCSRVNSLSDFKVILEECFIRSEYHKVFEMLSKVEQDTLLSEVQEKKESRIPLLEWEEYLYEKR